MLGDKEQHLLYNKLPRTYEMFDQELSIDAFQDIFGHIAWLTALS
jgi:phenylalanine-4-hydroxylase